MQANLKFQISRISDAAGCFHGHTLARTRSFDANFRDVDTDEEYWLSGPKRDRTDTRYRNSDPTVDDDAREDYEAFLAGAPLPGREHG